MSALYELTNQHQSALAALSDSDLPADVIADTLEGLEGEVTLKCESVAMWRENQLIIAKAKKEAAKKLVAQANAIEAKAASLMEYLDFNMRKSGINEIACEYFTLAYRKNPPSLNVLDAGKIPNEYIVVKTTESVDKSALKRAMQNGLICEGAEVITDKQTLIIK